MYIGDAMTKLEMLHIDIVKYNGISHIVLMGNINCRTGTANDFVNQENN